MKRTQVLSRSHKALAQITKEQTAPVLPLPQAHNLSNETSKKLNLHFRSRTRIIHRSPTAFEGQYYQTPSSFLPRIHQNTINPLPTPQNNEIDTFQAYVHQLLIKNVKQYQASKQVKSLQQNINKKKKDTILKQDQSKKYKENTRLQQLRIKLGQLYGQLSVEQNKLKIQYSVQEKMERKYNRYYDKLTRKFRGNTTVDIGHNTDIPIMTDKEQIKTQKNELKKKALSKFRVAAYAVYFSILFPKYSNVFRLIKKQQFAQRIVKGNSISNSIQHCYKLFERMKLKVIWSQIEYKNISFPDEDVEVKLLGAQNYSFKRESINILLKFVLNGILKSIKGGQIDSLIQLFPLILMNNSHITDTLFLQQELYNIKIKKQTSCMSLSQNEEKMMLLNLLLIKLTSFGFMINNSYITEESKRYLFGKVGTNQFDNLTFPISRQLLVCGIYLIHLCNKINKKSQIKHQFDSFVENMNNEHFPLLMPSLEIDNRISIEKEGMSKRTSIQDGITAFKQQNSTIKLENAKNLALLVKCFEGNSAQAQLLTLIEEIRDSAYDKSILYKKQLYKDFQTSFIEMKGQQIFQDFQLTPQRSEHEKEQIQSYRKKFAQKRQKERQKCVKFEQIPAQRIEQNIFTESYQDQP